jgi:serine/threonine protein kinase
MRQIVEGLGALHAEKVIRRELAPRFIILREGDSAVVLTDFELGKLLDSKPTVAGDWPGDPYRAEEVGGRHLTPDDTHVDFYSWARILVHAATGSLPAKRKESEAIESAAIPPRVRKLVTRCLSRDTDQRPRSAREVLEVLCGWN